MEHWMVCEDEFPVKDEPAKSDGEVADSPPRPCKRSRVAMEAVESKSAQENHCTWVSRLQRIMDIPDMKARMQRPLRLHTACSGTNAPVLALNAPSSVKPCCSKGLWGRRRSLRIYILCLGNGKQYCEKFPYLNASRGLAKQVAFGFMAFSRTNPTLCGHAAKRSRLESASFRHFKTIPAVGQRTSVCATSNSPTSHNVSLLKFK